MHMVKSCTGNVRAIGAFIVRSYVAAIRELMHTFAVTSLFALVLVALLLKPFRRTRVWQGMASWINSFKAPFKRQETQLAPLEKLKGYYDLAKVLCVRDDVLTNMLTVSVSVCFRHRLTASWHLARPGFSCCYPLNF